MRARTAAVVGLAGVLAACSLGLAADEYAGGNNAADGGDANASTADASSEAAPDAPAIDGAADVDGGDAAIPNLAARWRFDEGQDTTTANDVQGGPSGTLKNGALWAPGKIGTSAIDLDGADDYVLVGASPSFVINDDFTVTLWVRADSIPTNQDPAFYSDENRFEIKMNQGRPQLSMGAVYYHKASFVLDVGTWHHVAVTFANGVVVIYVDGTESSAAENTFTVGTKLTAKTGSNVFIGAYDSVSNRFDGRIDDVRVYGRALTSAEVQSIFDEK